MDDLLIVKLLDLVEEYIYGMEHLCGEFGKGNLLKLKFNYTKSFHLLKDNREDGQPYSYKLAVQNSKDGTFSIRAASSWDNEKSSNQNVSSFLKQRLFSKNNNSSNANYASFPNTALSTDGYKKIESGYLNVASLDKLQALIALHYGNAINMAIRLANDKIQIVNLIIQLQNRKLQKSPIEPGSFPKDYIRSMSDHRSKPHLTDAMAEDALVIAEEETGILDNLFPSIESASTSLSDQNSSQIKKSITFSLPESVSIELGVKEIHLSLVSNHSLWGNYLWNGARWMSDYILNNRNAFENKKVLELGAAAALPSLLAILHGRASAVIATDYPDSSLIENIESNIKNVIPNHLQSQISAAPLLWGDDAFFNRDDAIAALLPFDIVLLCDVIFNHSEHKKLLKTCQTALKGGNGLVWCVFTHYRPWLKEKDLSFFSLATDNGWTVTKVDELLYPELMFPQDALDPRVSDPTVMRTVYAYTMQAPMTAGLLEEKMFFVNT